MTAPPPQGRIGLLGRLGEADRESLGHAIRKLMANGSILGQEPGQVELYTWCHVNRDWVDELAGLLGLRLSWDHEIRIVQAVPETAAFTVRLKLDATLVLLVLWYEFDTAVRDRGEPPPIRVTVEQLNDSLKTKFEPLRKNMPSLTRLRQILSFAQRKNLLRFRSAEQPADMVIEVLPTLKRIIPFQDIDDWNRHAERHLAATDEEAEEDVE